MADETFRPRRPQQSNSEQQDFSENQELFYKS